MTPGISTGRAALPSYSSFAQAVSVRRIHESLSIHVLLILNKISGSMTEMGVR